MKPAALNEPLQEGLFSAAPLFSSFPEIDKAAPPEEVLKTIHNVKKVIEHLSGLDEMGKVKGTSKAITLLRDYYYIFYIFEKDVLFFMMKSLIDNCCSRNPSGHIRDLEGAVMLLTFRPNLIRKRAPKLYREKVILLFRDTKISEKIIPSLLSNNLGIITQDEILKKMCTMVEKKDINTANILAEYLW